MFDAPLSLSKPGLFITGTDTGVGKTLVTCALVRRLGANGRAVAAVKPLCSGAVQRDGRAVYEDIEALHAFAGAGQRREQIGPVTFPPPLAPAVAAAAVNASVDFEAIAAALRDADQRSDVVLVEGVGGLLVPIDPADASRTVLDLAVAIGLPVLVVCRAMLGTLNHTAMTVRLLRDAGCDVAGIVINGMPSDGSGDVSTMSNRVWIEKMTGASVLATVPQCDASEIDLPAGRMPAAICEAFRDVQLFSSA